MKNHVGTIHPPEAMFLRVFIGKAKSGKCSYEMATLTAGEPVVLSKQTGNWFTLSWENIIDLAIAAGIDSKPEIKKPLHPKRKDSPQ